eukprot:TRINITY_DN8414_c0_g2_i1.p1 TRINITY_DN8414_c0_g2~~TRINITY_DN8414_c0_g2_i1.p1  ORF type:complete len:728 (-),score=211.40 TRINITY_DN8414_c0_g2_i1:182-2365(-)
MMKVPSTFLCFILLVILCSLLVPFACAQNATTISISSSSLLSSATSSSSSSISSIVDSTSSSIDSSSLSASSLSSSLSSSSSTSSADSISTATSSSSSSLSLSSSSVTVAATTDASSSLSVSLTSSTASSSLVSTSSSGGDDTTSTSSSTSSTPVSTSSSSTISSSSPSVSSSLSSTSSSTTGSIVPPIEHEQEWDIDTAYCDPSSSPCPLTIHQGDRIRFTSMDNIKHNIHATHKDNGGDYFKSADFRGTVSSPSILSYPFPDLGSFIVICDYHDFMVIEVIVVKTDDDTTSSSTASMTSSSTSSSRVSTTTTTSYITSTGGSNQKGCNNNEQYKGAFCNPDSSLTITYVLDCGAGTMDATIQSTKGKGWVGFGLASKPAMQGADVVMGYVTASGEVRIQEGYTTVSGRPPTPASSLGDGSSSLVCCATGKEDDETGTTISFVKRLRPTGGSHQFGINPGFTQIIWAYHASADDFTTRHSNRGITQFDFYTGKLDPSLSPSSSSSRLVLAHGSLMVVAWVLLSGGNTYFARYLKSLGHRWFLVHAWGHGLAVGLVLISFIIIEVHIATAPHFYNAHHIIGIIVVGLAILQIIGGILSHVLYDPKRSRVPIFPDMAHHWMGRLNYLLALVNVFLGFAEYYYGRMMDPKYVAVNIIFALFLAFLFFFILWCEYQNRASLSSSSSHHQRLEQDLNSKVDRTGQFLRYFYVYLGVSIVVVAILIGIMGSR